jgi:hypothetical protein
MTAPAFSEDLAARSVWTAGPMRIDGLGEEWSGDLMAVHEKTKLEFAFRNDADYLYLLLVFKDPRFQSTLEKSGITVYFNNRGENKKERGIKFTKIMLTADQLIARRRSQGMKLTDQQIAEIRSKPFYPLFMYGMVNKKDLEQMATAKPSLNPDFNATAAGDVRIFEFKIPLAKNENQPFGIGVEPGGKVKIGIEWGGRTEAPTQQEADFTRRISERDAPGIDSQIRRGTPKYNFWVAVNLAPKS